IVIIKERNQSAAFKSDYAPRPLSHRTFVQKIKTAVNLVWKTTGKKYDIAFKHAVEPIRKSYLRDNFKQFESLFLKTTATHFREYTNIQRIVFPALDNARGRNTLVLNWRIGKKRITYHPNDSAARRAGHAVLWAVATACGFIKYDCYDKQAALIKNIRKYRPTMFAINEFATGENMFAAAADLMKQMFPKKSAFEK
ncbi:MAG: hypothetical protein FWC51_03710, partial [Proteobacteria bacterium]|nr:hypothetical protein [Pseudomonadota bacterium]